MPLALKLMLDIEGSSWTQQGLYASGFAIFVVQTATSQHKLFTIEIACAEHVWLEGTEYNRLLNSA